MSWLFSRALVEGFSQGTSLAGLPCAQLNVMPTPRKFWRNDKMMEFSRLSLFGLTLKHLTERSGEELLMSFLVDSRARTYLRQEAGLELRGVDQDCGSKWLESSARYDLASHGWRIAPFLLGEVSPWSSVILPRWGMTANGFVYQHPSAERPMSATESGSLLPTVTRRDFRSDSCSPEFKLKADSHARGKTLPWVLGGLLSPEFAEWMMGWPIGWTELKPLETARFQEWQQQHSICSKEIINDPAA